MDGLSKPPTQSEQADTIPVLVGEEAIFAYLDSHEPVPADARANRLKAAQARRRYLEEEHE